MEVYSIKKSLFFVVVVLYDKHFLKSKNFWKKIEK